MRIKPGASIRGLQTESLAAWCVVNETLRPYGLRATLTAGTDGVHSAGSKHYVGLAVDIRDRELTPQLQIEIVQKIKEDLGQTAPGVTPVVVSEFDVLNEDTHFHVEFDPKRALNR